MRRVVVTGLGITSCLGLDAEAVTHSLRTGTSGITSNPIYADLGMRSQVSGSIALDLSGRSIVNCYVLWAMPPPYALPVLTQAIEDAGLREAECQSPRQVSRLRHEMHPRPGRLRLLYFVASVGSNSFGLYPRP
jgi:3-oxoacyl-(acyl-carrier-protein) synthase